MVWRAEANDGRDGSAELIAEVETSDTLTDDEVISEWTGYARVPAPFYLVVPEGLENKAILLLRKTPVRVSQLWSYRIEGSEIMFTPVHDPARSHPCISNPSLDLSYPEFMISRLSCPFCFFYRL